MRSTSARNGIECKSTPALPGINAGVTGLNAGVTGLSGWVALIGVTPLLSSVDVRRV